MQIGGGLALLALGGEAVVRGAVGVARRLGVSELLIGLTLVGFGTSTPELLTSVNAALAGSSGIAVGNVVGSNIGNILLIFAIVMLVRPVSVAPATIRRDGYIMIGVSVLFVAVATLVGELPRWVGGAFLIGLIAYIAFTFLAERRHTDEPNTSAELHVAEVQPHDPGKPSLWVSIAFALGGLALLIFGADLLVRGAITLAQLAGMSETVIGLTIVAVGTSLPELVASLAAALKGRSDVAVGNIVGSNIYNILGILGLTALIQPVPVPADMIWRDWFAMLAAAVVLVFVALRFGRFGRALGLSFIAAYAVYSYFLVNPQALPGGG
ncbi:MAG: sodium:calcium antiporter [Hyphomonadaceae bacterium]|nr:sodium:calcium antiporter [Hyphomonadaceae bacterium]